MEKHAEYDKQLSELHEIITESRHKLIGGGVIALVWGILTAIAVTIMVMKPNLGEGLRNVWIVHNILGWTITLTISHYLNKRYGRVSKRGTSIIHTWAVWTLAIWTIVSIMNNLMSHPGLMFASLMSLLVGMGMFVTGLIGESRFSQIMGVVAMVVGPGLALYGPAHTAGAWAYGSMVFLILAWGVGSWVVREK